MKSGDETEEVEIKKKTKTVYNLIVGFVDNSYWDDGNRFTSREYEFDTLDKMLKEKENFLKTKRIRTSTNDGSTREFWIEWIREEVVKTTTKTAFKIIHLS